MRISNTDSVCLLCVQCVQRDTQHDGMRPIKRLSCCVGIMPPVEGVAACLNQHSMCTHVSPQTGRVGVWYLVNVWSQGGV